MYIVDIITHPAFIWTAVALILSGLAFWAISYVVASYCVYDKTLRNKNREYWGRNLPTDIDDESKEMYATGIAWSQENAQYKKDVHIVNNGFNLYGEYYDFGKDRCVMILSGRTECLIYGYYFAIPYAKNGCNVLVVDPRAHGLSDGEFNTVGLDRKSVV